MSARPIPSPVSVYDRYTPNRGFPELFPADAVAPTAEKKAANEEPPFVTIEREYKRVAKAIELMWGSRELDDYLQKLIVDDRGGRAGFPEPVLAAILKLSNQHLSQFQFKNVENAPDIWTEDPVVKRTRDQGKPLSLGPVTKR